MVVPIAEHDGRIYGFPTNVGHWAMWINKDMFDRAGEPYPEGPWKWDEFVKVAQRLTLRDEQGRITQFGFLGFWGMWPHFVLQWGGHTFSDDGTRCTLDSPEAIAAVQFLHDPAYPEEDYNAVWRDTMKYAYPPDDSPFIGGDIVNRIVDKQIDLVRNRQKSAAEAMRTATRMVDREMQKNIERDPSLRARYDDLMTRRSQ